MAPQTGTALIILVAFVLPGFVAMAVRERGGTITAARTPFDRLLVALYYSTLTYAVALGVAAMFGASKGDLIDVYKGRASLPALVLCGIVVTLVIPAAIAEIGRRWQGSDFRSAMHKSLDDSSTTESVFARVVTKDGRVLGGLVTELSSFDDAHNIYIQGAGYSTRRSGSAIRQKARLACGFLRKTSRTWSITLRVRHRPRTGVATA